MWSTQTERIAAILCYFGRQRQNNECSRTFKFMTYHFLPDVHVKIIFIFDLFYFKKYNIYLHINENMIASFQ